MNRVSKEPNHFQGCPCAELADPITGDTFRLIQAGVLLIRPDGTEVLLSNFHSRIVSDLKEDITPSDALFFNVQFNGRKLLVEMTLRAFADMKWLGVCPTESQLSVTSVAAG